MPQFNYQKVCEFLAMADNEFRTLSVIAEGTRLSKGAVSAVIGNNHTLFESKPLGGPISYRTRKSQNTYRLTRVALKQARRLLWPDCH